MSEVNIDPPTASSNSTNSTIYFDAENDEIDSDQGEVVSCSDTLVTDNLNGHDKTSLTATGDNGAIHKSTASVCSTTTDEDLQNDEASSTSSRPLAKALDLQDTGDTDATNIMSHDPTWKGQKKHIFILSEAGKPIYSLHGNEDKLAILFGIIQALVSFVENSQDDITSIKAKGVQFVFMVKSNLIFVAASRTHLSVAQLQVQLNDAHNQIISTLTYSQLTKIFNQRKNFDLRRLLEGSERLINNLLLNDSSGKKISNNVFAFLTNSIRILPLQSSVRTSISQAIKENCSKIKNLVFAILLAQNRLVSLVQMKKYSIHPADLRLIVNLIECSESFKPSENWTPICLPKFDMNGYLHAHVSYLEENSPACLLLLSVDRDAFFTLSEAKQSITEKLKRSQCIEAINEAVLQTTRGKQQLNSIGIPELRHFLYKPKSAAQILCSEIVAPYTNLSDFERLESIYCDLLERIRNSKRPLKLILETRSNEVALAWSTEFYELFVVFDPLTQKSSVTKDVDKLIKWIEKEYDTYFIRTHPTF
ncbi:vacuolar fusion protein MON1 homolog A [Musca vetustissima]|uniref:vacuolar fusion protein MON1 homolog A n=1 Tax=Musca vetustissima TaxID=27455 RepID=UPI002AB7758C|nr:vacuolar fusion protein MON1 homolog A [Musca vetustissima]